MPNTLKLYKKNRISWIICIAVIGLLIVISLVVFFSANIESVAKRNMRENLISMSEENNALITYRFNYAKDEMESIAKAIEFFDIFNSEEALSFCKIQAEIYGFQKIGIADTAGKAVFSDGTATRVTTNDFFANSIKGESFVSDIYFDENYEKVISISAPIYKNDVIVGVVFSVIESDKVSSFINLNMDNKSEVYISTNRYQILRKNIVPGDLLSYPENSVFGSATNIYDALEDVDRCSISENDIRYLLTNSESVFFSFVENKKEYYAFFSKSNYTAKWSTLIIVEYAQINSYLMEINTLSLILTIILVALAVAVICLIVIYFNMNRIRLIQSNMNVAKSEERLKIALEITGHYIYDYDIENDCILFESESTTIDSLFNGITDHIDRNFRPIINKKTLGEYDRFHEELKQGVTKSEADVLIELEKKKYWVRISGILYSNDKSKAVCIVTDISEEYLAKEQVIKEKQYKSSLSDRALLTFDADLNEKQFINLGRKFMKYTEKWKMLSYDEIMKNFVVSHISDEYQEKAIEIFDSKKLIEKAESGVDYSDLEVKMHFEDEDNMWVRICIHLIFDNTNNHYLAYVLFEDINEAKNMQNDLKQKAEFDSLSQIFNRQKFIDEYEKYMKGKLSSYYAALIILDLDDFKNVNDSFGHANGDRLIYEFAQNIGSKIKKSDLVGRIGGDEFVVLLKDFRNVEDIEARLAGLASELTLELNFDGKKYVQTCSMGIDIIQENKDFMEGYKNADQALYYSKEHGKKKYTFYKK